MSDSTAVRAATGRAFPAAPAALKAVSVSAAPVSAGLCQFNEIPAKRGPYLTGPGTALDRLQSPLVARAEPFGPQLQTVAVLHQSDAAAANHDPDNIVKMRQQLTGKDGLLTCLSSFMQAQRTTDRRQIPGVVQAPIAMQAIHNFSESFTML